VLENALWTGIVDEGSAIHQPFSHGNLTPGAVAIGYHGSVEKPRIEPHGHTVPEHGATLRESRTRYRLEICSMAYSTPNIEASMNASRRNSMIVDSFCFPNLYTCKMKPV
jgi:hypothetical protein